MLKQCNLKVVALPKCRAFQCSAAIYVYYSLIQGMRVPLEISLLSTLDHPNIVQVLDVHENEEYLQLIMQRHGAGMDLFEFLDRRPKMDEPLASYIFRQVSC